MFPTNFVICRECEQPRPNFHSELCRECAEHLQRRIMRDVLRCLPGDCRSIPPYLVRRQETRHGSKLLGIL